MMRYAFVLLFFFISGNCFAAGSVDGVENPAIVDGVTTPDKVDGVEGLAGFSCTTYDVCQHFEGTGYDNGETWSETLNDATINEDYSASPLEGSQSLQLDDGGTDGYVISTFTAHTDNTVSYVHFRFKVNTDNDATAIIFDLLDGALAGGKIQLRTDGYFQLYHGTANAIGTTDVDGGETWHVWMDWKSDTGPDDGVANLYVSATGTKPGSPDATITTGTTDYPGIDGIKFYATGGALVYTIDQVLVSNTIIGDVP